MTDEQVSEVLDHFGQQIRDALPKEWVFVLVAGDRSSTHAWVPDKETARKAPGLLQRGIMALKHPIKVVARDNASKEARCSNG